MDARKSWAQWKDIMWKTLTTVSPSVKEPGYWTISLPLEERKNHGGKLTERSLSSIWVPSIAWRPQDVSPVCKGRREKPWYCLFIQTERHLLTSQDRKKEKQGEKEFITESSTPNSQNTTPKRAVIMSLPAAKTVKSQKKAIQKWIYT